MLLADKVNNWEGSIYTVFRVLVGLLFMQHGLQKMFGLLGGNQVELVSLLGLAGVIELAGGLAIALGVLSRLAALVGGVEMLTAFFMAHVPNGWLPIQNNGEPALLFFAAFLVVLVHGNRKFSVENAVLKRETF